MSASSTDFTQTHTNTSLTTDGFSKALHVYLANMPYSRSQREKLADLVKRAKADDEAIVGEDSFDEVNQPQLPASPSIQSEVVRRPAAVDPNDQRALLVELCNDLKKAQLLGGREHHNTLYFSREYLFNAVLGVICPFKQPLYATFTLSSRMKVSIISFLGKRVRGINVGYCVQFDREVFFGEDGHIYLVDVEINQRPRLSEDGAPIYYSEEQLAEYWK